LLGTLGLLAASLIVSWGAPPPTAAPALPAGIVALAQQTKTGGRFMIEVDPTGRIRAYSAEVDLSEVPDICRVAADVAAPGGKTVGAEREVIGETPYWEIEKEIDGLRVEILVTEDGRMAGSERVLKDPPADVVAAANALVPGGEVVAVERVEGPETLGSPEHHVKKEIDGEQIRIRVTDDGAVERLRKMRSELRVP
jgi:hypothetical protein